MPPRVSRLSNELQHLPARRIVDPSAARRCHELVARLRRDFAERDDRYRTIAAIYAPVRGVPD